MRRASARALYTAADVAPGNREPGGAGRFCYPARAMSGGDDDALYDAYVEACLGGEIEPPEEFFARHPGLGGVARASIEAVFRNVSGGDGAPALPFEKLGEFRLLEPLDSGGMGNIFLAEQESLARVVALKIVRPELRGTADAEARFQREAQAVAQLRHRNIITVHASGVDRGVRYLAMEMVPGRQLDDLVAAAATGKETLDATRLVGWMAQLARALEYAHRRGIVHRDVKPQNIRITPDDTPLLLDFGIAYDMAGDIATLTKTFAGSPSYAAPEQIRQGPIDGRTDVYALGVTLYQCLTGVVPFSAQTVEGVFHRVLHEDATPPRRLRQTVSRELETVTLKAMEKRPAARYESAAAFADDLEAILAFRPIRARPPGPIARLVKWARRHPAAAVAVASAAILVVLLAAQRWSAARERHDRARRLLADARHSLDDYRQRRNATHGLEANLEQMRRELHRRYFTPEEDEHYAANETRVVRLRRGRDALFHAVLERLRRAEQLDPGLAGGDAVRAALYFEQWEEAMDTHDLDRQVLYRDLVRKHDREHAFEGRFAVRGAISLATDPSGADCYLYRFRELREIYPNGARRVVPVPVGEFAPPVPYGTLVRRVVGTSDLVVNDDRVPAGVVTRRTAAPLFLTKGCCVGRTPLEIADIEAGDYLVLVRKEGYEDLRVPFRAIGHLKKRVVLQGTGSTPAGWVRIPKDQFGEAFLIMEREVTTAEYLVFLNQAKPGGQAPLVPRSSDSPYWERGRDGLFFLPQDWKPDFPVVGVSFHDAQAYVGWASRRDGVTYALPREMEWRRAAGQRLTARSYVFGALFMPKWASSNWAKPKARVEPVMSYPVDESLFGVYDMAGSAMEWLDAPYEGDTAQRWLAGGAWGYSNPELFAIPGGWGARPSAVAGTYGFRMVRRR